MSDERDIIAATEEPATVRTLTDDLRRLGLEPADVVVVHTAMSALGWVAGGAQAVVEALIDAVSPGGTVVMPTQSGQLTDPANWSNPPVPAEWVDAVRNGLPLFDPDLTPTRSMGQVVECFRHHRLTQRSPHPTLSFAANGAAAERIVGEHPLTPAFGDESPLGQLYELDAKVLLLGVTHANNTSLHLAETRARWSGKPTRRERVRGVVDGERRWIEYDDVDHDESDFELIGQRFAATGAERSGSVGAGIGRICRQRALVDLAVTWIEANRGAAPTSPTIRVAVPTDIPALAPIEEAADRIFEDVGHDEFSGAISDEDAAEAIGKGQITVVEVDGAVLGWVLVGRRDDDLTIDQISVDPDHHRHGLGSLLMRHVMAQAGDRSIVLDTQSDVPWNQPWYEQLGFVVIPPEEWSETMGEVVAKQTAFGLNWETRVHMRWRP